MIRTFLIINICLAVLLSCKKVDKSYNIEIDLDNNWELYDGKDSIHLNATVPGTVIGELFKNQKIENPYIADNINTILWIEKKEWIYRVTFDTPREVIEMDSVFLSFKGLKGPADLILNDSLLGTVSDYYLNRYFDCKKSLKLQGNKLLVKFYPVESDVTSQTGNRLTDRTEHDSLYPVIFSGTSVNPAIFSSGIYEPVKLIAWSEGRINNVFIDTKHIENNNARLTIETETMSTHDGNYQFDLYVNDRQIKTLPSVHLKKGININSFDINIVNPEIWWCNGLGKPFTYELLLELKENKKLISWKKQSFGIRTIEIDQQIDSLTLTHHIKLNGVPVFVKGANYLPVNLFQLEPDAAKYEQIIEKAVVANMNTLRIWGGGIYEKTLFYDLCDKHGMMVWQDLIISNIDGLSKNIIPAQLPVQEIKRLRNHPSVVLWFNGWEQMNTYPPILNQPDVKYITATDSLFTGLFGKLSPGIPYYSTATNKKGKKNSYKYFKPFWPVWYNASPLSAYTTVKGGLITEFGVQSVPDIKTTQTFDPGNIFDIRSPMVEAHQFNKLSWLGSQISGTQMIGSYLQMYYNEPANNDAFLYLSQVFQSDALKFAIENFRIKKPSCMGSIFWHFNDCWPSISWSVVDFYGRNKPAYFAVKKAYENIAVIPEKQRNTFKIWVVNDSLSVLNCELSIMVMDFNGNQIFNNNQEITIEANASKQVFVKDFRWLFPTKLSNKMLLYTFLTKNGKKIADNMLYFVDPIYLDLPEPDINMQVINNGNRFQLLFRSKNLAKSLVLYTLNKQCDFSDNNFDLLPGLPYSVTAEYDGSEAELENDLQVMSLVDSY